MQAKTQNGPIAILFVSLVIVMLGFGIVVPILPYYVSHFGVGGQALGWLMAIYSIMQFIFAPVWGRLSDRVGRKPVFLIGLAGYALSFGLMGLVARLHAAVCVTGTGRHPVLGDAAHRVGVYRRHHQCR